MSHPINNRRLKRTEHWFYAEIVTDITNLRGLNIIKLSKR